MRVPVPAGFNLWSTVHSHGWSALQPFRVDRTSRSLHSLVRLSRSAVVPVELRQPSAVALELRTPRPLDAPGRRALAGVVRSCLRLDEDYSDFYLAAKARREYRWVHEFGAGRLLRAPSVFEDLVKMICTTNCSWALTEVMTANLCASLGERTEGGAHAFPTPETVAGSTESFLRRKVRAGYRAPYLLELSRRVAAGDLDVEGWRTTARPTGELFGEIRSVKGVGPYAAGNILKLIGRYDHLGIDSWCRKRYADAFHGGRKVSDRTIERRYPAGDPWRGLFFWMDMTKDWYLHGA